MKFEDILEINKSLIKIKDQNKQFDFELGAILVKNLQLTDKIVDEQNKKLNKLLVELGQFDGYDYVVPEEGELKEKCDILFNEDIQCDELQEITPYDVKNCKFDLTTIELIIPMVKK